MIAITTRSSISVKPSVVSSTGPVGAPAVAGLGVAWTPRANPGTQSPDVETLTCQTSSELRWRLWLLQSAFRGDWYETSR